MDESSKLENWLFSTRLRGITASAIVHTMNKMVKSNDLNTYKYLTYLLSQRQNDNMSDEQLEQLAPGSEIYHFGASTICE